MLSFFANATNKSNESRTIITVHGYNEFTEKVNSLQTEGKKVFCLFVADADPRTPNKSWCPDTDRYAPVVTDAWNELDRDEEKVLIKCCVGGREYWKGRGCEFRKDPNLKLAGVPTLMRWGGKKKLKEGQLTEDKVRAMLQE